MRQKKKPIDKQLLKNWRLKLYDTTYLAIAEQTQLHENTVAHAFRDKKATQVVISKLTTYFNEMEVPA